MTTDSAMPIGSTLTLKQPEYSCPVHGNITQHTVQFSIAGRPIKLYCLVCMVDKMVEAGVCEVTRIEP
jgi:predicted transcriptional regulator